jgi:hypothetical protein
MSLNKMDNDWKEEAPKLAAMRGINPFSVPEGYFNTLPEQINSQLLLAELHPGNATGKFTVPDGYFEDLAEQIKGRVSVEDFKGNSFTVPEGYFNRLQDKINAQISEPVKVVPIRSHRPPAWINYAAAACVTIAVSITLYFNIFPGSRIITGQDVVNVNISDLSNKVSDEDIIGYLKVHSTRSDLPVIIEALGENVIPSSEEIPVEDVQAYLNDNSL